MILAIFICVLALAKCFIFSLWYEGFDNLESGTRACRSTDKPKRGWHTRGHASPAEPLSALHSLSGREKHNLRRHLLARIKERRK